MSNKAFRYKGDEKIHPPKQFKKGVWEMGKLAETVITKKKVVLKKKVPEKAEPKVTKETKVEKPVLKVTVKKSIFPELKSEETISSSGMLTKKGTVYLFHRHNREKVCKPIKMFLKESVKDKSLFSSIHESFIDNEFDRICLRAFEKASNSNDKTSRKDLVDYIVKSMSDLQTTLFNDLSLLDI